LSLCVSTTVCLCLSLCFCLYLSLSLSLCLYVCAPLSLLHLFPSLLVSIPSSCYTHFSSNLLSLFFSLCLSSNPLTTFFFLFSNSIIVTVFLSFSLSLFHFSPTLCYLSFPFIILLLSVFLFSFSLSPSLISYHNKSRDIERAFENGICVILQRLLKQTTIKKRLLLVILKKLSKIFFKDRS
jgi:hypothetical protein